MEERQDGEEREGEERQDGKEEGDKDESSGQGVWLRGPSNLPKRPIPIELRPVIRPVPPR